MLDETAVRAELARLRAEMARAQARPRTPKTYFAVTLPRIETLQWVLGEPSLYDDERR